MNNGFAPKVNDYSRESNVVHRWKFKNGYICGYTLGSNPLNRSKLDVIKYLVRNHLLSYKHYQK